MKLSEAFRQTILGKTQLVAGKNGLDREVRWVHIVDMPDVLSWVRPGQLLLTTGYAWTREDDRQRELVRALAGQDLAGIGLAVPRFFDHFPRAFREEADRLALPLIEIPWEIPFSLITEELHTAILAEQTRLLEQSERIHRTLTHAALETSSLQEIAATLGDLIHHSVTFEDQDGRILGSFTIPGTLDRVRRETLATGVTPRDFLDYLERSGYQTQIDTASQPLRIPPSPDHGFVGRIVCPIRLKGETVGRVWILESDDSLTDLDLRAAEHAATVAALQIAHQRAIASIEARVGYSFLSTILEGRFEATPEGIERAQIHGLILDGRYRVATLLMDEALPLSHEAVMKRERLADRLRQQLLLHNLAPLLSVSLNQIPFIMPETVDPAQIWQPLGSTALAMGISRVCTGVEGIRQGYLEVQQLLPHLSFGTLQRYDDLLLPRVLKGDSEAQDAFLAALLEPFSHVRNGDVLLQTLLAFAQHGFHLRQTAHALHIHPKSLRYRLERAAEVLKIDLNEPDTRFRVQLAAHILDLRGPRLSHQDK